MSFEHRKYHGLYFILGFIIAAMLVMLLGCKPAETTGGISYPPPPPCCAAMYTRMYGLSRRHFRM